MKRTALLIVTLLAAASSAGFAQDAADEQARRDAMIVQALLRLERVDLDAKPPVKAALLRYMDANRGTQEYLDLAAKFDLRDDAVADGLAAMALRQPPDTLAVDAARQLTKIDRLDRVTSMATGDDPRAAAEAMGVLGFLADGPAGQTLEAIALDATRPVAVRTAAVKALAQGPAGQQRIIALAAADRLPAELQFAASNALLMSTDQKVRDAAAEHIKLPAAAGAEPLPPIAVLVKRTGDPAAGKEVYMRSCVACHKTGDAGIDFGPALTEIGSKLAPPAMYEAILDPSAGISFGFEGFTVEIADGGTLIGYVASETDDTLTLRIPGGVAIPIDKAKIKSKTPMTGSLMTPGLQQTMTTQQLVDLVAYLLSLKKPE